MASFVKIKETRYSKNSIKRYKPSGEKNLIIFFNNSKYKIENEIIVFNNEKKRNEAIEYLDSNYIEN